MKTQTIKGTITENKEGALTLRIWLNGNQRDMFLLERGVNPSTVFKSVIIMDSAGDELTKTKSEEKFQKRIKKIMEKTK